MDEAISGKPDRSGGWPEVLAGLETLLATGARLPAENVGARG